MASLYEIIVFVLSVTVAGLHALNPVLGYLHGITPQSLVGIAAAAGCVTKLILAVAFFTGTVLVHIQAEPALVSPAALRRLVGLACATAYVLLLLLAMPLLVHVLFLAA